MWISSISGVSLQAEKTREYIFVSTQINILNWEIHYNTSLYTDKGICVFLNKL